MVVVLCIVEYIACFINWVRCIISRCIILVLIGLFCCLSEMGGSSHRRSASPEYELDAFEFFSVILGTSVSATRQVYKTRDLPFTHLIMITLLFATSLLVPNCRGCLTLLWTCWVKIRHIMWSSDRPAAGFAGCGTWSWWSRRATCTCALAGRSSTVPRTCGPGTFFSWGTTMTPQCSPWRFSTRLCVACATLKT